MFYCEEHKIKHNSWICPICEADDDYEELLEKNEELTKEIALGKCLEAIEQEERKKCQN